ncbi:nuclear transport factor 2 family protein [Saccharomonospora sp. NPDC006951]
MVYVSPRSVFEEQLRCVAGKEWDAVLGLYADDAVVEQPFARPHELRLEGREAIGEHFARAGALPMDIEVRNLVVHESSDPEVIIAECDYRIVTGVAGRESIVHNIFVVCVRDGKIAWSRDYHDMTALGDAMA